MSAFDFLTRAIYLIRRYRKAAVNYIASFVSSTSYAVGVYVVTLIFAFTFDVESVGRFRYVLSIIMILNAFTLVEANKLFLKRFYDEGSNLLLLAVMVRFSVSTLVMLIAMTLTTFGLMGNLVDHTTLLMSFSALPLFAAFDLHNFINFARKSYVLNAITNIVKYTLLCAVVMLLCLTFDKQAGVGRATIAYFWIMGAFNICLFALFAREFGLPRGWSRSFVRDSFRLSLGGIPQTVVENLDKVIVGIVFGPAMLGIYALNTTTGRLLNTAVKPGLVVLYPYLARNAIGDRVYLYLFLIGSALVVSISPIVYILFQRLMDPIYSDYFGIIMISMTAFPCSVVFQIKLNEVIFNVSDVSLAARASSIVGLSAVLVLMLGVAVPGKSGIYICASALSIRYLCGIVYLFHVGQSRPDIERL